MVVYNTTALHIATEKGHEQNVDYLLACGADINSLNAFDETPLIAAVSAQHQNEVIIKSLIAYTVKIESYNINITSEGFIKNKACIDESQILTAIKQKCLQKIQEMKSINIRKNLSFFDIFMLQKKDINTLARCANNPYVVKYQNKFSIYSSFIEKSIRLLSKLVKVVQNYC
ncbi:ankyrin repeat domain-containing protein [Orientia tsutsugamushi]|uniref:ankyrin repeat domain-containing protein n=1 Tax=Orientia tsutsugamushi TaxID=784 RepID=UPI0003070064|nr:ankyrin repeat domain-containing protein [Orientia tsutsugamushi]